RAGRGGREDAAARHDVYSAEGPDAAHGPADGKDDAQAVRGQLGPPGAGSGGRGPLACRRVKALLKRRVANVLGGASFAYLAVETSSGPHVTPLLFAAT